MESDATVAAANVGGLATMHGSPHRLLAMYQRGAITGTELVTALVQAAATAAHTELSPCLPSEWLEKICQLSRQPPASIDGVIWLQSVCAGPGFDWEQHRRRQCQLWYDGIWRWHQHFHQSHP